MLIKVIAGFTRALGAPKDWDPDVRGQCRVLPILDVEGPAGHPSMISSWEVTDEELAKLQAGAPIYLSVQGTTHPPVALWVGDVP